MGINNIISDIGSFISGGATNLISSVSKIIDQISGNDEEKLKIKWELQHRMNDFVLSILDRQSKEQEELTKRLQADMTSDSWLSKNIRPMTLIYILMIFTIIIILNAFNITIDQAYVELLKIWGALAFSFYFGSRWNEKITKIKNIK